MSVDAVSERCPAHPQWPACWMFKKGLNSWPAMGMAGSVADFWTDHGDPLPQSQWPEIIERWCSQCGRKLVPSSVTAVTA